MNIRSALVATFTGLLWSVSGHATGAPPRDALLLEFVQDMAWLEDSSVPEAAAPDAQARIDRMNAFFDAALERLNQLPAEQFDSLPQVADAFTAHQKLVNQLGESALAEAPGTMPNIDLASLDADSPKIRVRLENLALNYLHLAQLVLFDELGGQERRLPISAQNKQRLLTIIARYPVDQENADGYLSAMWFIREGLKKWKCVDEA